MHIVAALFLDDFAMRDRPGGAASLDLTGVHFSTVAPHETPCTVTPHLIVLVHEPPGGSGEGVLEVVYTRGDEQIARNVQPLQVEPGKFSYRLVRAELDFVAYETVVASCRIGAGESMAVPFTLLPPL